MKKEIKKKQIKALKNIKFSPNLDTELSSWLHTNYLY